MVQEAKFVAAASAAAKESLRPHSPSPLSPATGARSALPTQRTQASPAASQEVAAPGDGFLAQPRAAQFRTTYARIQAEKDELQTQAIAGRQQLAQAETAQRLLREMKDNLVAIVKNYPPFPLDSLERQRYLEMAEGLRKQMEALIVPPPARPATPGLPGAAGQWLPPAVPPGTDDAGVAQAVSALEQIQTRLGAFGDDIRASWRRLPMTEQDARQLSVETSSLLARMG